MLVIGLLWVVCVNWFKVFDWKKGIKYYYESCIIIENNWYFNIDRDVCSLGLEKNFLVNNFI